MPADRPDPEAALSAAEAAHLAARETVPIDVRLGERETVRIDVGQRETVRLPVQRGRPGPTRRRAPLVLAAAVAAGWAALLSYAPVVAVLGVAHVIEGGSVGGGARLGLAGWLLGHGVPLETADGTLGLTPLGLSILAAWRLIRAGVHTVRGIGARGSGSPARALAAAAAIGLAYGLLGALAAPAVGPQVSSVRAGATLAVFGTLASLLGAVGSSGALGAVAGRIPGWLGDALRTGVVVALLLLAAGATAAGSSLALAGGEATDVLAAYRAGVAGQAGVTLVCLAYAPNAAVWAVAYLVGPGFAVGTNSVVRVTEVTAGDLPALPILAGLPAGPVGGAGAALIGVPVVAGIVGGWLLARRCARRAAAPRPTSWARLLGAAALAGPVAGGLLGLVAAASSGPLAAGRLSEIGPVAWQVAAVSAGVVALGTVVGAAAGRTFLGPADEAGRPSGRRTALR